MCGLMLDDDEKLKTKFYLSSGQVNSNRDLNMS